MGKNQMNGLQLIKVKGETAYYWFLDYRYIDGSKTISEFSIEYPSEEEAIKALLENKITWRE